MDTKRFHLSDVLTITTGKLLSTRHVEGVYDICNFMTGDNLFTHQLPRAMDECKPYLLKQFPDLGRPEVTVLADGELTLMLERTNDPASTVLGWLSKLQAGGFGVTLPEFFDVTPLPEHAHEFIDPMSELAETVHPDRIITVARD